MTGPWLLQRLVAWHEAPYIDHRPMGGEQTFEAFFKQHFQRLYLYALHLLDDEEDARDIVSEAMVYVWQNYSDRSPDKWFTYTVSFIRNKCFDHIRRKAVHRKYADFYIHVIDHKDSIEIDEDDQRWAAISKAMDLLNPKTRLVLDECYVHHKKYREVAEELGISESAVKKHIVKALRVLRETIAKKTE